MNNRYNLRFLNIKKLDISEKVNLLQQLRLPPDAFSSNIYNSKEVGKDFTTRVLTSSVSFYSLRYTMSNSRTAQQFFFHNFVVRALQAQGLFPAKAYFFIGKDCSFLMVKQETIAGSNLEKFPRCSFQKMKDFFLNILEVFRALDNINAILLDNFSDMITVSSSGEIQFRLSMLAYLYERKNKCYANAYHLAIRGKLAAEKKMKVESKTHVIFHKSIADIYLHKFCFVDFVRDFALFQLKFFTKERASTLQFAEKTMRLDTLMAEMCPNIYTWRDLRKFLKNFGKAGNLADQIKAKWGNYPSLRKFSSTENSSSDMESRPSSSRKNKMSSRHISMIKLDEIVPQIVDDSFPATALQERDV